MDEIEALVERIDRDPDVDALRRAISDLIGRMIAERRDVLDYWEKQWFAQALASLAWNVGGGHRDSTAWLRLSLAALHKALVPVDQRSEDYTHQITAIEALTAEQLLNDAQALGGRA